MPMKEHELLAILENLEQDAVNYSGEFMELNETLLDEYFGNPYGDEQEDESQVVSTDVSDTVESDLTSLMRVFGTSQPVFIFEPTNASPQAKQEAEEKTAYINWIINSQDNSYKIKHDWIKSGLMQKFGVVRFGVEESEKVVEKEFEARTPEELVLLVTEFQSVHPNAEIVSHGDDGEVTLKYKQERKRFVIENIPTENFLISRNAPSINDAALVGDRCQVTKSYLVEMGIDVDIVRELPSIESDGATSGADQSGSLRTIRFQDQGGDYAPNTTHWTNELVWLYNLYPLIDYDDDGIAERRHILKVGRTILENDPHEIAPYAMFSSVPMPHLAIGRCRAELSSQTQRIKTFLNRQLMNNIANVGNSGVVVNDELTNVDDLLVGRTNRIVRTAGDPMTAVAPLQTNYIGEGILQVVQYFDSLKGISTGDQLANQGLDSDQLYSETATRYLGVREENEAKIELVARNIAEIGFRDLYVGLAWLVENYQNEELEIMVLGQPMKVDPRRWKFDHHLVCQVGLAAGDDQSVIQNMSGLITIDAQLKQTGSLLVDDKKTYNKLAKMCRAMGLYKMSELYNDPEIPQELLLAQNEQLMNGLEQAQMQIRQMSNPLADVERIKAQKEISIKQQEMMLELEKFKEEIRQFNVKTTSDRITQDQKLMLEATKIEATTNKNVPGSSI